MTAGPGVRVAAMLSLLRDVADEIVVAVDDRAPPDVRDALATVADRLLFYPYAEPVDRPIPWLHTQCSGDWVLNLDDDEVPSPRLISELPQLLSADDVTHYWIPRRWVYPDVGHYLAEAPWCPDYQLRLVRNDPRLLRFSADLHRPLAMLGPGRFLELPVWHLDCTIRPYDARVAKALKYERMRPGLRLGGRALNAAYFLPELRPDLQVAEIPAEDRSTVEEVLSRSALREQEPRAFVERKASREEIDRLWPGRAFAESSYAARLEFVEVPRRLTTGEERLFDVRVVNGSDETWSWGIHGEPPIRLAARWLGTDAPTVRTALPADVAPGAEAIVPVLVTAPSVPGRFVLEVDLVHEHVRWFENVISADVTVVPPLRIAIVGGDDAAAPVLRLLELQPELEALLVARDAQLPWEPPGLKRAPGIRSFIFGDDPDQPGSPALGLVFARRSRALVRAARRVRTGGQPDVPAPVASFLDALAGCGLLVIAGADAPPNAPPPRELARIAATVRVARTLGVPVAIRRDALPVSRRAMVRRLSEFVLRHASIYDEEAELQPLLARLAAAATP